MIQSLLQILQFVDGHKPAPPPSLLPSPGIIFRPAAVFNKRKCVACCTASCVIFLPEACFIVQIIFIIHARRVSALPEEHFDFFFLRGSTSQVHIVESVIP